MTPLPGNPRKPRVNSQKLYVAVFYNILGTAALPLFATKLYVDGFTMNLAPVLGLLFTKSWMFMVLR